MQLCTAPPKKGTFEGSELIGGIVLKKTNDWERTFLGSMLHTTGPKATSL